MVTALKLILALGLIGTGVTGLWVALCLGRDWYRARYVRAFGRFQKKIMKNLYRDGKVFVIVKHGNRRTLSLITPEKFYKKRRKVMDLALSIFLYVVCQTALAVSISVLVTIKTLEWLGVIDLDPGK